jgi:hypothetical protein
MRAPVPSTLRAPARDRRLAHQRRRLRRRQSWCCCLGERGRGVFLPCPAALSPRLAGWHSLPSPRPAMLREKPGVPTLPSFLVPVVVHLFHHCCRCCPQRHSGGGRGGCMLGAVHEQPHAASEDSFFLPGPPPPASSRPPPVLHARPCRSCRSCSSGHLVARHLRTSPAVVDVDPTPFRICVSIAIAQARATVILAQQPILLGW